MFKTKKRIFIAVMIFIIIVVIGAAVVLRMWQVKNCPEVVGGMPGPTYDISPVSPWCSGYGDQLPS